MGNDLSTVSLEWVESNIRHSYGTIVAFAQTPFGRYKILKGSQGRFEVYFGDAPYSGSMETEDEAMRWAQEDFTRRILSVVVPTDNHVRELAQQMNRLLSMPTGARDLSWRQLLEQANNELGDSLK